MTVDYRQWCRVVKLDPARPLSAERLAAVCPWGADDVVAVTRLAEHLLRLPIFYLEYSGTYGSPQVLRSVRRVLSATRLWYGGGIRMPEQVS